MEILKFSKGIDDLANEKIAFYQDVNNNINIILKDSNIKSIEKLELLQYYENGREQFVLKLNDNKIYQDFLIRNEENKSVLEKIREMEKINVVIYSKDKDIQHIAVVTHRNI